MMYLTFFFTITLFLYGLYTLRADKKKRVKARLSSVFDKDTDQKSEPIVDEKKSRYSLKPLFQFAWKHLRKLFQRKRTNEKEEKLELKLLQAGNPFGMRTAEFRLVQLTLLILFPLACVGYGYILKMPIGGITFLVLVGVLMGIYLPHYYIKQKSKIRNHLALRELPDFLDLLTVSLEAGLGFDGAISKVVAKKQGVLSSEFHRALEEIRLGKTRREALLGVRERLLVDEIRTLMSSIIQAEKLGIGMVQVLRVQSNEVREQRKQRAEEAAMKAPIKMLFPLVLFIFPSLFIVLLGPAIIQFVQTFQ
ncbi:tight adherence protein C [Bacillus oleivorans]|uniref:Tight adherence protein C n=1 Tax=Bacillus oleivorans TaxID=1448271 RepID=A0A285CH00_9BACI|nr:type II secretion system F family protein [Bacillus oleivorans]SNX66867.1 tight adherence protein C [Bacillus oleivorans]